MTDKHTGKREQEALRIKCGLQCPECFGPQIVVRESRFHGCQGFLCEACGCQFSPPAALKAGSRP